VMIHFHPLKHVWVMVTIRYRNTPASEMVIIMSPCRRDVRDARPVVKECVFARLHHDAAKPTHALFGSM
jgi:hypothetical protein